MDHNSEIHKLQTLKIKSK